MVLSQLKAGVETRAGALLTGARGSGKTTSARVAFDELAPGFDRAAWITGTAADSRVPFGAFERLFTVPETGRTIQVLRAAREALGTGLLLVVDDGHLRRWCISSRCRERPGSSSRRNRVSLCPRVFRRWFGTGWWFR